MSRWLRQSTAHTERIGPFLDVTDGFTEETALTPSTEISKDGGAFEAGPTGAHNTEGWYSVAFTTIHTNTLGNFIIKSHQKSNHRPVSHEFIVIPANVYDSLVLGTGTLHNAAPQKNAAFSDLEFLMTDSTTGDPKIGLTVTGQRSLDGGAFAAVTGSIAEVGNGIYQFDAVAADMNADLLTFRFSSAGAKDTFVTIKTRP